MLAVAKKELLEAITYYNSQREGLGFEFAIEIKDSILRISNFSDAWQKISARSRRCLLKRFPYAVLYRSENNEILIVAIMHMSRNPQSWKDIF
jgi:plasmid stabilization system protein ParE